MDANYNELSNNEIIERLKALELRMTRLESGAIIESTTDEYYDEQEPLDQLSNITDGRLIESKIGESGLAWLGNIVLFLGITFLVQYIQNLGYHFASSVFGYASVAGIFVMAHYLKKSFPKMASIFNMNAWLLLFYVTLRLHFFSEVPIVSDKLIGLLLLSIVTVVQLFIAVKRKLNFLAGVSLVLLSIIAVVSDTTHFMLPMAVVISIVAVLFLYLFGWIRLLYLSIILVYSIMIIWFLNDPFMGHQLQAITVHHFGFVYLFFIAAIYSMVPLVNKSESFSTTGIVGSIILNGLGFSTILLFIVLSFFKDDYVIMIGSVSAYCLLFSVVLQLRSEWKITAALYALFGFVTFSIAVHGIYDFPRAYFLLALQSLLVVSMAIWFRSKFIVVMNALLFLIMLIFYLGTTSNIDGVNISFTLVAMLSARILNWKKDKLTIKTEMLRNFYLLTGFVMTLVTLYNLIPDRYITLSWTLAAVLYFVLSLILKKVKYRYMALGTMIAATFYLFLVDLANIGLIFRIIALMFLALISIGLSIYYTKKSKRKSEAD